jgi:peptide/nickel transport system substrate-binding protein
MRTALRSHRLGPLQLGALLLVPFVLAGLDADAATLRYAEDQGPGIVHPAYATTMGEARLNELVFEALFTDDRDLATKGQLAETWELAPDGLSLTLRLRDGVKWHDGRPVTADDVVFTIQALGNAESLSPEAGRVGWIAAAEAPDPRTVVLQFAEPETRPEDKLFFKILPQHRFSGTTLDRGDGFRRDPVGSGPYEVVRFNDDASVTLRKATHPEPARIDEIVMREVSDKGYQAKMLLYQSLEALVRVLPRDLAVLQANPDVTLYPYQTNSWWYVGFNLKNAPFDDPAVRHALAQMVDVEALLAPIGTGEVVSGPYVPSSPYYNHDVAPWAHSASAAATELEAAGWAHDASGWTKDGEKLAFTLTAHRGQESAQEVVINLQSQLRAAGVPVEVEFLDEAAWRARVWRGQEFEAVLSQWTFDRNEDVREQLHSQGTRNFTGYASEAVDALLDEAQATTDPQARKRTLRSLHKAVHDDAPMLFLWTLDSYSAVRLDVKGVSIHPFYFFTWVRDWRMP